MARLSTRGRRWLSERVNSTDFVEKLRVETTAICFSDGCQGGKAAVPASCGEDRLLEGYKLRQLPQFLGCGGQQELVFGSAWSAEAQSTEPEDALQMSEEHFDLLPLPASDCVGLGSAAMRCNPSLAIGEASATTRS
jgi:hypothetical protein